MASNGVENQPELTQDAGGMVIQSGVFAGVWRCTLGSKGGHGGTQAEVNKAYAKASRSAWPVSGKKGMQASVKPCSGLEKAELLHWYK